MDPYYQWLGIPPQEQPPNHYRLLGINLFEHNREVIESAANQRMAYLQQLTGDPESIDSAQKLLGEVSRARLCLLNDEKRQAYDATLRAKTDPNPTRPEHTNSRQLSLKKQRLKKEPPNKEPIRVSKRFYFIAGTAGIAAFIFILWSLLSSDPAVEPARSTYPVGGQQQPRDTHNTVANAGQSTVAPKSSIGTQDNEIAEEKTASDDQQARAYATRPDGEIKNPKDEDETTTKDNGTALERARKSGLPTDGTTHLKQEKGDKQTATKQSAEVIEDLASNSSSKDNVATEETNSSSPSNSQKVAPKENRISPDPKPSEPLDTKIANSEATSEFKDRIYVYRDQNADYFQFKITLEESIGHIHLVGEFNRWMDKDKINKNGTEKYNQYMERFEFRRVPGTDNKWHTQPLSRDDLFKAGKEQLEFKIRGETEDGNSLWYPDEWDSGFRQKDKNLLLKKLRSSGTKYRLTDSTNK